MGTMPPAQSLPRTGRLKRRINTRLLVLTAGISVVAAISTVALWQWQIHRNTAALLRDAERLEAGGHYREAAQRIHDYLRFFPDDSLRQVLRAELFDKAAIDWRDSKQRRRVVELYYLALGSAEQEYHSRIQRGLIPRLLRQDRFVEAITQAEALLAEHPEAADAWRWLAIASYRLHASETESYHAPESDSQRPGTLLEWAIESNPGDPSLTICLAEVYRKHRPLLTGSQQASVSKRAEEWSVTEDEAYRRVADAIVDRMVREQPNDVDALLARYEYRVQYNLPDAVADIEKALGIAPEDHRILLAAASHEMAEATTDSDTERSDRLRRAEGYLRTIIDARKSVRQASLDEEGTQLLRNAFVALARVEVARDEIDRGIAVLDTGLRILGASDVQLHICRAELCAVAGRVDEATESNDHVALFLRGMARLINPDTRLSLNRIRTFIRAKKHLQDGRQIEAMTNLTSLTTGGLRATKSDHLSLPALLLLARACSELEEWDGEARAYRAVLGFRPESIETRLAAADAWERAGQRKNALETLMEGVSKSEVPELWLAIARLRAAAQFELDRDERDWSGVAEALAHIAPDADADSAGHDWRQTLLRARIAAFRCRELPRAKEQGSVIARIRPADQAVLSVSEAQFAFLRHLIPGSELEQFTRRFQSSTRGPPVSLAELRSSLVGNWLVAREQQFHGEFHGLLLLADFYDELGRSSDRDRVLEQYQVSGDTRVANCVLLAEIHARQREWKEAHFALASATPANRQEAFELVDARCSLLLAEGGAKNLDAAAAQRLRAFIKENPHHVTAIWRMATYQLMADDDQEFDKWIDHLKQVEGQDGYRWRSLQLERILAVYENDVRAISRRDRLEAHRHLASLKRRRPEWTTTWSSAARLAVMEEHPDQAAAAAREAVELGSDDPRVCRRVASLLVETGRLHEASRLLQDVAGIVRTDPLLMGMTVSVWLQTGRIKEALALARHACGAAPSDPAAWVSLANALLATDDLSQARQALDKAVGLAGDVPTVLRAEFEYLVAVGDKKDAEIQLHALIAASPADEQERLLLEAWGRSRLGQMKDAASLYQRAVTAANGDSTMLRRVAQRLSAIDPEASEQLLRRAIRADPENLESRRSLASLLLDKSAPEAWQEASDLLGRNDSSHVGQRLRAITLLHERKDVDVALAILEGLVENGGRRSDRLLLANACVLESALCFSRAEWNSLVDKAHRHYEWLASGDNSESNDAERLIDFLIRYRSREAAEVWLPKLKAAYQAEHDSTAVALTAFARFAIDCHFEAAAAEALAELGASQDEMDSAQLGYYFDLCWKTGRLTEADRILRRLQKLAPKALSTVARGARLLEARGESKAIHSLIEPFAIRWFESLDVASEKARLARTVGDLYSELKKETDAVRWYTRLNSLGDGEPLLRALAANGRVTQLLRLIDTHTPPAAPLAAELLVDALTASNSPESLESRKAVVFLSNLRDRYPDDYRTLCAMGRLRQYLGQVEEAEQLFRRAVQVNPAAGMAYAELAQLLSIEQSTAYESIRYATRAMQGFGPRSDLLACKGVAYLTSGSPQEALDLLSWSARSLHTQPQHKLYYAVALARCGHREQARSILDALDEAATLKSIPQPGRGFWAHQLDAIAKASL